MAIATLDDYIGAAKQVIEWFRNETRTMVAFTPFSVFDLAGQCGGGALAGTSTAAGIVPDGSTVIAGYPTLNAFGGGAQGYLTRVAYQLSVAGRVRLFDRVFVAGAYAFNANVNLASQPSFSTRVPSGTDYKGLQIWIEPVTGFTGNLSVNITYINQDGASKSTGTFSVGVALTVGRCVLIPLASGDTGVQRIDNVTGSVASAGTFNVMVLRSLWSARVLQVGTGDAQDLFKVGAPEVFAKTAFYVLMQPDATAPGVIELTLEVANK